ncbi:MAG: hypothetical protein ABII12_17445 [Planctomycetota bacterium]
MFPDNFFADTAGSFFTALFDGIIGLVLAPLTALTDAMLAFLTSLFTF